jgi:periplasmic protein CpxP/Spy
MSFRRIVLLAASALALSAVVSLTWLSSPPRAAHGAAPPPVADSAASRRAADRDEWHIKELHDRLKITTAQEPLWETVAGVMRDNDEKIDALSEERHDRAGTMTAIEDLHSFAAIAEAHAAGTRSFIPAFEALYQAMPAEQQVHADRVFRAVGSKSNQDAN